MAAVSLGTMELSDLCRNQPEILTMLKTKGVTDIQELSELVENDVKQLKLKDLVVRRRLLRYIQETSKPLPIIKSIEDLCLQHVRSINALRKAGVVNIQDLLELEPEDINEIEIAKIPVLRRIHKYISAMSSSSTTSKPQHHTLLSSSSSSLGTISEPGSTASTSTVVKRSGGAHSRTLSTAKWTDSSDDQPKSPSILLRTRVKSPKRS